MIVITWDGLTQYAVRCMKEYIGSAGEKVIVVSTPNPYPAKNLEENLGCMPVWVEKDDRRTLVEVVGEMPRAIVVGGWSVPCFVKWMKEAKIAGSRTIFIPDEAWGVYPKWKDLIKAVRYRLFRSKWIDRIFCCGVGGRRLYRIFGVPNEHIYEGLYAGDPVVFHDGAPVSKRPKSFIYVGRYIPLKNVIRMGEAFVRAYEKHPDWTLEIYGNGELESQIPKHPAIHVHGYVQTDQLGDLYRNAQCFILGSWKDNWGVVVHEAALCGCLLLLSERVGAAQDFAADGNSAVFNPYSVDEFAAGMEKLMDMSDAQKDEGGRISLKMAQKFSPKFFAAQMRAMTC